MIIQKSIETYTNIPVLGIIPRQLNNPIPERHMGLSIQNDLKEQTLNKLAQIITEHVDTHNLINLIPNTSLHPPKKQLENVSEKQNVNIAYLYDEAFGFIIRKS